MTDKSLRIAICCSGGDSPGMNPWIRAMVRLGLNRHDLPVIGIKGGYAGLVRTIGVLENDRDALDLISRSLLNERGKQGLDRREQNLVQLDNPSVGGLSRRGGTMLGAGRC